jgi:uncharacterized membrane protein
VVAVHQRVEEALDDNLAGGQRPGAVCVYAAAAAAAAALDAVRQRVEEALDDNRGAMWGLNRRRLRIVPSSLK